MRFYEYEAKALFAKHNTPLLKGRVAKSAAEAKTIAAEIGGRVVLEVAGADRRPHEGRRRQVRRHPGAGRGARAPRS